MAKPGAIVSRTVRLERGAEVSAGGGAGEIALRLDGDRRVRLDPADRRSGGLAEVLDELSRRNLPVYLEVDPETEFVTRLLIPLPTRVEAITEVPGGIEAILAGSHARHRLDRGEADYDELAATLRDALKSSAPVLVTRDDAGQILDVTAYTPDPEGPPLPFPERRPWPLPIQHRSFLWRWLYAIWFWELWPWWWWRWFICSSTTRAGQIFAAMAATTCDPLTVPAPCIPFMYPDDGCWARAHEMSRLMLAMPVTPGKVWNYGNLRVNTRNNPSCSVGWWYHVAPTICVRWFFPFVRRLVIDPSLFSTLVNEATWKGIQGDPASNLVDTAWTQYGPGGGTDPAFADTAIQLADYRLQLKNRSIQFGPPPYANCP